MALCASFRPFFNCLMLFIAGALLGTRSFLREAANERKKKRGLMVAYCSCWQRKLLGHDENVHTSCSPYIGKTNWVVWTPSNYRDSEMPQMFTWLFFLRRLDNLETLHVANRKFDRNLVTSRLTTGDLVRQYRQPFIYYDTVSHQCG